MSTSTPQRRWKCPYCDTEGWETGLEKTSPRYDHDRPDGRRCRASAKTPKRARWPMAPWSVSDA